MKRCLLLFMPLICCFSCASQKKEVIAKSTIKLEGKDTNIRNLLDIDGIYGSSTVFFDDGSLANTSVQEIKGKKTDNLSKSVNLWKEGGTMRWGSLWGVYTIKNDTIIAHFYTQPGFLVSIDIRERRYKIINRKTIQLFYSYNLLLTESDKVYLAEHNISPWVDISKNTLSFSPIDSIPPSDNWLKEKKWIWRNESDWKAYMQHVEQIKKQYKKK